MAMAPFGRHAFGARLRKRGQAWVCLADFNNDGLLDISVANDSYQQFLFKNMGKGVFQEMGGSQALVTLKTARASPAWEPISSTSMTTVSRHCDHGPIERATLLSQQR
jgi:hypothetical protein